MLVITHLAQEHNMIAIHYLLTVNYTIPTGGRVRIENNATQPSCAGVGAELGNNGRFFC